jgi:hypothetical protein
VKSFPFTLSVILLLLAQTLDAAEQAVEKGLVVLVDCKDIPEELRANKALRIHGLTKNAEMVQGLRKALLAQGAGA